MVVVVDEPPFEEPLSERDDFPNILIFMCSDANCWEGRVKY